MNDTIASPVTATSSTAVAAASGRPIASRRLAFTGFSVILVVLFASSAAPSPFFVVYQAAWGFAAWLLTFAFAVYAVTLLLALLTVGSLSDHIGRRPVLIGALILQVVAMVLFAATDAGNTHSWRWLAGLAVIGVLYWLIPRQHVEDLDA